MSELNVSQSMLQNVKQARDASLTMANIDTLKLYNKAGFEYMVTGFESASPRVLKHMKKNKNMKTVRKIFENIREINEGAGEDNNEYGNNNNKIKVQLQLIIGYLRIVTI